MKFGGTSVQGARRMRRAVRIVGRHRDDSPLVVVSAVGGTTRALLQLGGTALAGGGEAGHRALQTIEAQHRAILDGLGLTGDAHADVAANLKHRIEELGGYVDGIVARGQYTPRIEDAVISFGERLSTMLFVAAARRAGLAAVKVDAGGVMITDDAFRQARPDFAEVWRRAALSIAPLIEGGEVPVIEGFIGATADGTPTTMGFEASDYTAGLLGAALEAREIQIWTDVPGMLTTGYPGITGVAVVPKLSFDEARLLAENGAKVLHPDTVAPARDAGIPVTIRHSEDPDAAGTLISAASAGRGFKAIAVQDDIAGGRTLICPVGEGIGGNGETARRAAAAIEAALGEIPHRRPASSSPHCVLIDVPRRQAAAAVQRLHEELLRALGDACKVN